jgi:iron complex outermembrane receptor protein
MCKGITALFFILLTVRAFVSAQIKKSSNNTETADQITVSGVIKDAESKRAIPYCNIIVLKTNIGTSSDDGGKFKFLISKNLLPVKMVIANMGYETDTFDLMASKNNYQVFLQSNQSILKEVVVTEYSREYLIKEEPASIKLVSAKSIERTIESNIVDAMVKNIPGLNAVKTGPNVSKPFIHGLGYNRIETTYDNVPVEGQQFEDEEVLPVDQYNIERAEVTLGPTCLMDGPDALAGIVALFPAMPKEFDKKIHGRLISEYQGNNGMIGNGLRITYGDNYWAYAIRGSYRIAKNYSNALEGRVYNTGFRESNASATLIRRSYNGSSSFNFTLYDNSQGIPDGSRDSVSRKFTKAIYDDQDIYSRPVVSQAELDSYKMSPIVQRIQHYRIYNNNHYSFKSGSSIDGMLSFQQNVRREFDSPEHADLLGVSMRLNSINYDCRYHLPTIKKVELITGINGMYQTNKNVDAHDIPIPDYKLFDIGTFIFAKWKHTRWNLSSGVGYNSRHVTGDDFYTREDVNGLLSHVVVPDTAGAELLFPAFKKNFRGLFADIGATFVLNDHWNLKANVARGSGAPHVSEFASNGLDGSAHSYFIGKPDLVPEYCWQADVGISNNFKDVDASLNVFFNDLQEYIYIIQLTDDNGNPIELIPGNKTFQYHQGSAQIYGVESMINYHPKALKGFNWINYFSLVYGVNTESQYKGKGVQGRYLSQIPPMKFVTTVSQNVNVKSKIFPVVTFTADADINAAQNRYLALNETETATAGYIVVSLSVNCSVKYSKKSTLQLQLQVANLFDEVYQTHLSRLKYFEHYSDSPDGHLGIYNMGRNICGRLIVPF